jgi:hypothetical protein
MIGDICQNNHGGNEYSAAAHRVTNKEGKFRKIVDFLCVNGPATCEEIVNSTGMVHQTASARVSELKAANVVVAIGERKTSRGCNAQVWAINGANLTFNLRQAV